MANVWSKISGRDDPYRGAFRAEWGLLGRARFEWHREKALRARDAVRAMRRQPESQRGFLAGFLVVEGLVALAVGLVLMVAYWPAVQNGAMANPVSFCGLALVGASVSYILFVGLGLRLYALLRPAADLPKEEQGEPDTEKGGGKEEQKRNPGRDWPEAA